MAEAKQIKDEKKATEKEKAALALSTKAAVEGAKVKEDQKIAAADDQAAKDAQKKMIQATNAAAARDASVSATAQAKATALAGKEERASAEAKAAAAKAAAMAKNNLNGAKDAADIKGLKGKIAGNHKSAKALEKKAHSTGERAVKTEQRAKMATIKATGAKKDSDAKSAAASKAVAAA